MATSYKWDQDGDGKLTSQDLMGAFDSNQDGVLDSTELSVFVEQLSNQLQYNNTLLTQLNELEKEQLAYQHEITMKQEQIKKMSADSELLKVELNETKKRLKISQETIESLTNQARDCRSDSNLARTEAERAIKDANSLKELLDRANSEKSKLMQDLAQSQQNLQQRTDLNEKFSSDSQAQISALRQANEASDRELKTLRENLAIADNERKTLISHLNELSTSLEKTTSQYQAESLSRESLERHLTSLTASLDEKQSKYMEMEFLLNEAVERSELDQENLRVVQEKLEESENKIKSSEEKLHEASNQIDVLKEQNNHLVKDIETVSRDLDAYKKAFQGEQEKWSQRIQAIKDDSARALVETKRQSQDFVTEAQKQLAITAEARSHTEELLLKAQSESNAAHELIDQLRHDHAKKEAQMKIHHTRLEENLEQERARVLVFDEKFTALERKSNGERDQLQSELRNARLESVQRGEMFVNTLVEFQKQIKILKEQSSAEKSKVRELGGALSLIKAKCAQQIEKSTTASNSLKSEVEAVFQLFIKRLEKSSEQHETTLDLQKRIEIENEEQKSKCLDLEDAVSRLEHKLATLQNSKAESEHLAEAAISQQKSLTERYAADKLALENKIQKLQQALNETTASARNIQANNLTMHATIGDVANKQAIAKQDVESKLAQISSQLKHATEEKEFQEQQTRELRGRMTQLSEELHAASAREERANREIQELKLKQGDTNNQHLQMLSTAGEATQQYNILIRQLQDRLQIVQQQKNELQTQNQNLRLELESKLNP